jgi:glyoxylate reductase
VGFGRIGREMAKKARAFNMKILYYDKIQFPREVEEEYGAEYAPLHKLLRVGVRASRRFVLFDLRSP